ncbi:MAG: c-type cytochrome, partial [Planctomycetota bacterium]
MIARASLFVGLLVLVACGRVPLDKAARDDAKAAKPVTWQGLYATNCAGCHGGEGTLGPARPMRDATYLVSVPRENLIAA